MQRGMLRFVLFVGLFLVISDVSVPKKAPLYADAGMCHYYGSAYKYDYGNNYQGHIANEASDSVENCTPWGQSFALSDCAAVCGGVGQHGVAYCYVYWDLFEESEGQAPHQLGHVQQQYDCADVR